MYPEELTGSITPENLKVEYKARLDRNNPQNWIITVSGFSNAAGGTFYIGAEDKTLKLMPCFKDLVFPLTGRRRNSGFTDSNQRTFLDAHPVRFCRRVYQRKLQGFPFLSSCLSVSFFRISPISTSMQMACSSICGGQ